MYELDDEVVFECVYRRENRKKQEFFGDFKEKGREGCDKGVLERSVYG